MALTAKQHSQIAMTYQKAAVDRRVPPQARVAFAHKADWFRMLARIAAKKEAAMDVEHLTHLLLIVQRQQKARLEIGGSVSPYNGNLKEKPRASPARG